MRVLRFADRRVLLALVLAVLIVPSSAHASVADEQQQGQQLAEQVQSGQRPCRSLSPTDLDHIGEFVMGRMVGSTSAHQAMNQRMTQVLGEQTESRMHQALGARFVGCAAGTAGKNGRTAPYGPGSMMGNGGMMGNGPMMGSGPAWRGRDQREWGAMMRSGRWDSMMSSGAWPQMMGPSSDWSWMMGSRWQGMSTRDW